MFFKTKLEKRVSVILTIATLFGMDAWLRSGKDSYQNGVAGDTLYECSDSPNRGTIVATDAIKKEYKEAYKIISEEAPNAIDRIFGQGAFECGKISVEFRNLTEEESKRRMAAFAGIEGDGRYNGLEGGSGKIVINAAGSSYWSKAEDPHSAFLGLLGHEIGHHVLRHLKGGKHFFQLPGRGLPPSSLPALLIRIAELSGIPLDELDIIAKLKAENSRTYELEADLFGMLLTDCFRGKGKYHKFISASNGDDATAPPERYADHPSIAQVKAKYRGSQPVINNIIDNGKCVGELRIPQAVVALNNPEKYSLPEYAKTPPAPAKGSTIPTKPQPPRITKPQVPKKNR